MLIGEIDGPNTCAGTCSVSEMRMWLIDCADGIRRTYVQDFVRIIDDRREVQPPVQGERVYMVKQI
jgi:hypothetical protein